ncbi:hypothetical protein PAAG_05495 [Paracoccidioides lutzii Pb01]|uniref:Uncharacterized protein n=1 Tax=Paracoccidioides lutzii (strain ATCC MYA-826 / Pb01) TaxID=502779 RepID=C1H402_PARBA|nr:hypothetical protein PAAG_05495 [Paracoccidioides lutzii Pb01]EEH34446.1 hypothetical protein PAAG_05495 [Paracoccidioides lutzii Pb01]
MKFWVASAALALAGSAFAVPTPIVPGLAQVPGAGAKSPAEGAPLNMADKIIPIVSKLLGSEVLGSLQRSGLPGNGLNPGKGNGLTPGKAPRQDDEDGDEASMLSRRQDDEGGSGEDSQMVRRQNDDDDDEAAMARRQDDDDEDEAAMTARKL